MGESTGAVVESKGSEAGGAGAEEDELDEDADDHKSSSSINSGSSREQSTTPPRSLEPAINSTRRLSALERGRRLPSGEWKHHKRRDEADFLLCGMNRNEHRRMTLIFGVSSILPI